MAQWVSFRLTTSLPCWHSAIGGAASVTENFEVDALLSSLPARHPLLGNVAGARPCAAGASWEWDGVRFAFLHPRAGDAAVRRNNQSCVMKIEAGGASMLLTGDIERLAEFQILEQEIKADVLLVPHHGSRTSSSREFIDAVAPRWALVPTGYRNRFGHPNPEVLERYRAAGARLVRTDLDGAINVVLNRAAQVDAERARRPRYWRAVPPAV